MIPATERFRESSSEVRAARGEVSVEGEKLAGDCECLSVEYVTRRGDKHGMFSFFTVQIGSKIPSLGASKHLYSAHGGATKQRWMKS